MDTLSYDKVEAQNRYFSALFTQLVLNGLAVNAAKDRANEAIEVINRLNLKFPDIHVG